MKPVSEEDKWLLEKLTDEFPAMLAWAVSGVTGTSINIAAGRHFQFIVASSLVGMGAACARTPGGLSAEYYGQTV